MKKYTRDQLWDFVWRADTIEKVHIAERWMNKHIAMVCEVGGIDLWDDLMVGLSQMSREIYRERQGLN